MEQRTPESQKPFLVSQPLTAFQFCFYRAIKWSILFLPSHFPTRGCDHTGFNMKYFFVTDRFTAQPWLPRSSWKHYYEICLLICISLMSWSKDEEKKLHENRMVEIEFCLFFPTLNNSIIRLYLRQCCPPLTRWCITGRYNIYICNTFWRAEDGTHFHLLLKLAAPLGPVCVI